jgi:hypothetical protein
LSFPNSLVGRIDPGRLDLPIPGVADFNFDLPYGPTFSDSAIDPGLDLADINEGALEPDFDVPGFL